MAGVRNNDGGYAAQTNFAVWLWVCELDVHGSGGWVCGGGQVSGAAATAGVGQIWRQIGAERMYR